MIAVEKTDSFALMTGNGKEMEANPFLGNDDCVFKKCCKKWKKKGKHCKKCPEL